MKEKTTKSKGEQAQAALGNKRQERMSLAESRDKIYEKFYNNIRVLIATETISMVDLSRILGLKSGTRLYAMCYGRALPSTEELIVLARHYKCTIDDLLNNSVILTWQKQ